jgi:Protein of unknown function (DUF3618)
MSELVPAQSAGQETAPAAPAAPADAQQLRAQIARTRENLGEAVEQLAAKMDVKSRARAEAAQLIDRVRQRGTSAREAVPGYVAQVTGRAKQAGNQARQSGPRYVTQAKSRALQAGNQARHAAPDRARQVATQGAKVGREQRMPLAIGGGALVVALVAAFLILRQRKQR